MLTAGLLDTGKEGCQWPRRWLGEQTRRVSCALPRTDVGEAAAHEVVEIVGAARAVVSAVISSRRTRSLRRLLFMAFEVVPFAS